MAKVSKLRMTLGWMIFLVALAALAINAFRPIQTRIMDVKLGTGPAARPGNFVTVRYVGKLDNGTVFDKTDHRGQVFNVVPVGGGLFIKGWEAGLIGMQVGGIRQLDIPPEEGYGAKGMPPKVPPHSRLHFEIEVLQLR